MEVSFDIDANGIVSVAAKDLGTGKQQSIKITAPKKLSKEEIEKMVRQAEQFASDDAKRKEEVEVINKADTLAYSVEKSLKDYGDKVSQTERADIEAKLNDLRSAIKDKNLDRIKKASDGAGDRPPTSSRKKSTSSPPASRAAGRRTDPRLARARGRARRAVPGRAQEG